MDWARAFRCCEYIYDFHLSTVVDTGRRVVALNGPVMGIAAMASMCIISSRYSIQRLIIVDAQLSLHFGYPMHGYPPISLS